MKNKETMTFTYLNIDPDRNLLLCSTDIVGLGELVEIHAPDDNTPRQACGKLLRKMKDKNLYIVHSADMNDPTVVPYEIGSRTVLRVMARNRSGMLRRKFTPEEKLIVNLEKNEKFRERQVVRAKTGSVRKRKKAR
jgi:hypothetical protein